jgi:hypothetical protein
VRLGHWLLDARPSTGRSADSLPRLRWTLSRISWRTCVADQLSDHTFCPLSCPLARFLLVRTFITSSRARGARRIRSSAHVNPAPHATTQTPAHLSPGSWPTINPGTLAHWAPPAAFGPGGPRRRRRALGPRKPTAPAEHRDEPARARALQNGRHPPGDPVLSRAKITVKSAPSARPSDGASATPDCDLPRLLRRLSEGWPGLSNDQRRSSLAWDLRGLGHEATLWGQP